MTTDDFTTAAWEHWDSQYRTSTTASMAFAEGATWARDHIAQQEPTDAEVEAARIEIRDVLRDQYKSRYNLGRHTSINPSDDIDIDETAELVARAALTVAKEALA